MKEQKQESLSYLINNMLQDHEGESISLKELILKLESRGFGILMFLFSFPMAIPLPYPPGFTTILGLPLFFFAIQMMLGTKNPWLPEWIAKKELKISHVKFAINGTSKIFLKLEKLMRPRLLFFSSTNGEKLIGAVSFLCAISIVLPIFLGNSIPSAGIMLMSIGFLYKDGIMIMIGIVTSILGLFVASLVVVFGIEAIKYALAKTWLFFVKLYDFYL